MTTATVIPPRVWHREPTEETRPVVLVSSRDDAPVPRVAGAVKLVKAAETNSWMALQTYALADMPEVRWQNGNVRKAAHRLASVAVRLVRDVKFGYAVWYSEDDGPWRFGAAFVASAGEYTGYAYRDLCKAVAE